MGVLVTTLQDATKNGLRHILTDSVCQPVVEWLLVSDGRSDTSIRYLVGAGNTDILPDIKSVLRTALPNTYELRELTWHPRRVHEHLPVTADEQATTSHPSITATAPYVAGVEYRGHAKRRSDWQTPLVAFDDITIDAHDNSRHQHAQTESRRVPLATLVETMQEADIPIVYQAVCQPYEDWSSRQHKHIDDLRTGTVTIGDKLFELVHQRSRDELRAYDPPPVDETRIERISSRDPGRTLCVSARAVALTRSSPGYANDIARTLANAFGHIGTEFHEVRGHLRTDDELHSGTEPPPGTQVLRDICNAICYDASYETLATNLPTVTPTSRGIVVGTEEVPNFCLLDGAGITPDGKRALGTRATERTGVPLPPPELLARYTGSGMALGMPLTHDRQPYGRDLSLPPAYQDRHVFVGGDTGAGKSVLVENAMLTNAQATDGPDILIDSKGGGTAEEYLRAHYAAHGNLDDVRYFDCTEVLPALSFFDIRSLLEAGVPRAEATARKAGQYEEILTGLMGAERFGQAVDAPKVIRNHVKALFDPIHGADRFGHGDLYDTLRRTMEWGTPPAVSDDGLDEYFANLLERDREVFQKVMGGAVSRVDTIATDGRLAPLFDHVPAEDDPTFDFADVVDEDTVVVFDFGGMEDRVKRTLTLVLLSNLWTALKARTEAADADADLPLVNLYLEEAADVANTSVVETLLSQGRSFGLSVTLGTQFPEQLKSPDPEGDTYHEVLNEIATFVIGNVAVTDDLTDALATEDMEPAAVDRRLGAMQRGEWLVRPASPFGQPRPRPFLAQSLAPPAGHPASADPLSETATREFAEQLATATDRTATTAGISQSVPTPVDDDAEGEGDGKSGDDEPTAADLDQPGVRVDSLLPYTQRLPDCVTYDAEPHALRCASCESRYDPTGEGMRAAIDCCHTLADVDRDDIPVCEINLKLTPAEIEASDWSLTQLLFVQAVYNAQQLQFDRIEYDIVHDSMVRLREYVALEYDAVEELVDTVILRDHGKQTHKLYSVAPRAVR
jgi:DNA helicase HerA-like ATPase